MIQTTRIKQLNENSIQSTGKYIIYWMQASQRTEYNHAYDYALQQSKKYQKPVIVFFGLTDKFPEANLRHYIFMLQGLNEVKQSLEQQNIQFIVQMGSPEEKILPLSKDACMIITDRGYLRIQRKWREIVAKKIRCPLIQVETDVIIPVEEASIKQEYSAATFRPKLTKKLPTYLYELQSKSHQFNSLPYKIDSIDPANPEKLVQNLSINTSVKQVKTFTGGLSKAKQQLQQFIKNKLEKYPDRKNDPSQNCVSNLSPYLHFGQISPLFIALEIRKTAHENIETFLEELITRRELSINYVFFNPKYDMFTGIPLWAKTTLLEHKNDKRPYLYNLSKLEHAETHDDAWNAAQKEMMKTGKMHGYMRMYWGKKIIEWTKNPEEAYRLMLYLNNKYELDGRDPNGFTGVAWCFGTHDRPWKERSIFGKIRYMNRAGLQRKFDIENYIKLHN